MNQQLRLPNNYNEQDKEMSNFDGSIDDGMEDKLKSGKFYGSHSAWNFCGTVWFNKADNRFYEEIWHYRSYQETFSGESLEKLMDKVNEEWGDE